HPGDAPPPSTPARVQSRHPPSVLLAAAPESTPATAAAPLRRTLCSAHPVRSAPVRAALPCAPAPPRIAQVLGWDLPRPDRPSQGEPAARYLAATPAPPPSTTRRPTPPTLGSGRAPPPPGAAPPAHLATHPPPYIRLGPPIRASPLSKRTTRKSPDPPPASAHPNDRLPRPSASAPAQ